jgi:hypothetical protein
LMHAIFFAAIGMCSHGLFVRLHVLT